MDFSNLANATRRIYQEVEWSVDVLPVQFKTAIEVSVSRLKSMPRIEIFAHVLVEMPLIGQYDDFVTNVPNLREDPDPDPFPDGTKAHSRYSKSVEGPTPFFFFEGMLNFQSRAVKGNVRLPKELGDVPLLVWQPRWYMSAILRQAEKYFLCGFQWEIIVDFILRIGQNFAVCGILPLSHSL